MHQQKRTFQGIPNTTLRRLRNTPSYFFLIWRWSMWVYALIVTLGYPPVSTNPTFFRTALILLIITFLQTLIVTLYAPVFQILLPGMGILRRFRRRSRPPVEDDEIDIFTPLAQTRNRYWDIFIHGLDVLICGLALYYAGPMGDPPFGAGSPFYRYGMSTAFAAALAYRYVGGLAAALGYDLFAVLGMVFPAPGAPHHPTNTIDVVGSLIDTPVAALLAAYLSSLLTSYARNKREIQNNVRRQKALRDVAETIVREADDKQRLLQKSAEQICQGGHFHRLILVNIGNTTDEKNDKSLQPEIDTCIEINLPASGLPERNELLLQQVIQSGQKLMTFESFNRGANKGYGHARLYLPLFKDGQVQMVLGAENWKQTPFDSKAEVFLTIAGAQLLVALEKIRLTEQMIQLAATAERGRIAREIHDGIAQLIYMLSLTTETCATQAHRLAEASEEDAELLTPLAERLDRLVTISKQALWETRNYMFTLKPLMSGTTTLAQMLENQLREFEAISNLPAQLEVTGSEMEIPGDRRNTRKLAEVGSAIFRIVQEALTNAYKHAEATQLHVCLRYETDGIAVEISDNGHGLQTDNYSYDLSMDNEHQRIYSGHGLRGMRERAEELGGTFEITQIPGNGITIQVWIPTQGRS